ncbi:hypothetical protein PRK78_001508 [Emydomyces testavorans]|uniref:Uncharacterized protein n=1 Tax=Emydomyces testavorans TaxID=2070801 RepID=A0AAF0DD08_9EURO|nr:hypothetical protein PRK78_001508 [Emydomyces testavorans]
MAQGGMGRVPALFMRHASQTSKLSQSSRSFSSTSSQFRNIIPAFKPTSSPELDELLETYRQQLFIPRSLSLLHRNLIYKQKNAEKLKENPISVNIGGENEESYVLKPMQLKDQPGSKEFRRYVSLMKTREDWLSVLPFLVGLQDAKRPLAKSRLEWLIRKAGLAGHDGVIVECVKQSKRTGLTLQNPSVTRTLFLAIRHKAQQADFKGPEVETALRRAQQMAELLDAPEHTARNPRNDAKRMPDIIAVLLELSAAHALDAFEGKDAQGKVRAYAERLLSTWLLGKFDIPAEWTVANFWLLEVVPVWHCMKLALQVEEIKGDIELSKALKSRMDELGEKIETAVERVTNESGTTDRAGVALAKQLYHK